MNIISETCRAMARILILVSGSPRRRDKRMSTKIFEEIMTENFKSLIKKKKSKGRGNHLYSQETQQTQRRINKENHM
jgi:hypothetical protein